MRLLCVLAGGPDHPSSRFRVLQHLERLRSMGIEAETFVAKRIGLLGATRLARRARRADAILIQKKIFSPLKLRALLGATPCLFDMDDAYFAASPDECQRYGPRRAERRASGRARRLEATLRRSRKVIVGNEYLAAYARQKAQEVAVLPTGIDLRPFSGAAVRESRARRQAATDGPRIGWIGSRPSLRYLVSIAGPLREVCARFPGARLVQICNDFASLPGVPCETRMWSRDREALDLMELDVGLMPLDESAFSRGKCGFKILQYHAAALPVVCSPIGANREMVSEGETGLFAGTEKEWTEQIARVLSDRGLARALGERGRRQVQERYEASGIGTRLAEIVRSTVTESAASATG